MSNSTDNKSVSPDIWRSDYPDIWEAPTMTVTLKEPLEDGIDYCGLKFVGTQSVPLMAKNVFLLLEILQNVDMSNVDKISISNCYQEVEYTHVIKERTNNNGI